MAFSFTSAHFFLFVHTYTHKMCPVEKKIRPCTNQICNKKGGCVREAYLGSFLISLATKSKLKMTKEMSVKYELLSVLKQL